MLLYLWLMSVMTGDCRRSAWVGQSLHSLQIANWWSDGCAAAIQQYSTSCKLAQSISICFQARHSIACSTSATCRPTSARLRYVNTSRRHCKLLFHATRRLLNDSGNCLDSAAAPPPRHSFYRVSQALYSWTNCTMIGHKSGECYCFSQSTIMMGRILQHCRRSSNLHYSIHPPGWTADTLCNRGHIFMFHFLFVLIWTQGRASAGCRCLCTGNCLSPLEGQSITSSH